MSFFIPLLLMCAVSGVSLAVGIWMGQAKEQPTSNPDTFDCSDLNMVVYSGRYAVSPRKKS